MFRSFTPAILATALVALSCATAGTRPDDMSAADHRARAAEERQAAAAHEAQYDESARAVKIETSLGDATLAPDEYNPTHWQHEAALAHERTADAHLKAATTLETSEDAECTGIAPAARAACPLFTRTSVTDIDHGVKVTFGDVETAARASAVIRCQQAFARTRGYQDMPSCTLYARGLQVKLDGATVELRAKDDADVERLRTNVRAHGAK